MRDCLGWLGSDGRWLGVFLSVRGEFWSGRKFLVWGWFGPWWWRIRPVLVVVSILLGIGAIGVGAKAKWNDHSNLIDTRSLMEAVDAMAALEGLVYVSSAMSYAKEA